RELFPPVYDTLWHGARSAFVTVMHGCDNHCSYCIVPSVRGGEVSRTAETILEEIRALVASGIREVTLLGQNVNSYHDPAAGLDFTGLLYLIAGRSGLDRLRFVTSHPRDLTPALAAAFAEIPSLMPYLHLPAQSGSDRILALMNRGYGVNEYQEKIAWVRERCPDISLSSDFIVGFPGETESEFEETLSLIGTVRYDTLFAFKYSPRPGTVAARWPETLTDAERSARLDRLLHAQRAVMTAVRRRFLGRTVTVLIESRSPRGDTVMGRSEHNQIVHVAGDPLPAEGSLVPVRITEVLDNTLRGDRIDGVKEDG
ncbi:MAG TPA: MiaB/RimO family radical SAM methylthiotransferase, partial [bacterium]|nr:MiaB/RimO family radical SAM methylthiotransferase [bacterium]